MCAEALRSRSPARVPGVDQSSKRHALQAARLRGDRRHPGGLVSADHSDAATGKVTFVWQLITGSERHSEGTSTRSWPSRCKKRVKPKGSSWTRQASAAA